MARKPGQHRRGAVDIATEHFNRGLAILRQHPLFASLLLHARVLRHVGNVCPDAGWAVVTSNGDIHVHPTRRGDPDVWVHVLAHCLLHLGFGHFQANKRRHEWNTACDCVITRFLADLKLGRPPQELLDAPTFSTRDEERVYQELCAQGIPAHLQGLGTAGPHHNDMVEDATRWAWRPHTVDWQRYFSQGLTMAVTSAVNVAGGREPLLSADTQHVTPAHKARSWFISSYPLLGALAAAFTIVEDARICGRLSITVAAVDAESKKIFINPAAGLDEYECRFVMAHELLHVGLRHQARCLGRDPYLWNVACDYVVNGWLVEMGLGELPHLGVLYDPALKGESAEAIYDRIVTDMRRYRKLATLRGFGLGDMLERGTRGVYAPADGVDLDAFYRGCLSQGLMYHEEQDRGFLPAGLVEEIRVLYQLPMPWDVELAKWFEAYFSPLEKIHSYARPSRRQSSTPDIPRPRWAPAYGAEDGRTFGVILDTSGSMDRILLAKALGTIASYSIARDVPAVRVVFCDAVTYDQGYMPPEVLVDRVRVQGRGGTILQPAVDLLETAGDFPPNGPVLIITDGACDRLHIRREHAFLLPAGRHLPFVPKGKVFRIH